MQYGFPAANNQRVSGVISSLKTGDYIRLFSVKIDDFTLALVSPLSAYDSNIGHDLFPTFNGLDRNNIRQLWQYHDAIASRCRMDI
jgi:hypothetical protein